MTKQELLQRARELPPDDQVDLAMDLWDALVEHEAEQPLTDAQRRELDERRDAAEAEGASPEDWSTLRERILRGED